LYSTRINGDIHWNRPDSGFDPLNSEWTMVCPRAPCDITADRRLLYGIEGPGIIRSLPFTLPQGHLLNADVRVAHLGTRTLFRWMSVLGGISAVTGTVLLTLGAVESSMNTGMGTGSVQQQLDAQSQQQNYFISGGVLLGGGALLLISGIIASVYTRTSVNVQSDGRLALNLPGKATLDLTPLQVRF